MSAETLTACTQCDLTRLDAGDVRSVSHRRRGSSRAISLALLLPILQAVPGIVAATPLSDLADSMQAGEWAKLSTTNIHSALTDSGSSQHILTYSNEAKWNPKNFTLYFIGGDHNGSSDRFITFNSDSNSWTVQPPAPWMNTSTTQNHSYDYQAIDTEQEVYYYKNEKFDIRSGQWSPISTSGLPVFGRAHLAQEFFPGVGLVRIGDGGVYVYQPDSNSWRTIKGQGSLSFGGLHPIAEYSAVHRILIFGGGDESTNIYRMDANSNIVQLGSPPMSTFSVAPEGVILTTDPASGDFLVLDDNAAFYQFDAVNDRWSKLSDSVQHFAAIDRTNKIDNVVASPIVNHSITMFVMWNLNGASTVWLYKHASGGTALSRPKPPDNVGVN